MTDTVDLSWAVQKAIFNVLSPAVAPVQLVDALPSTGTFPDKLVYFGDDVVQEIGGKDGSLERHDISINVVAQGNSRKVLRDLQAIVKATLHNQPISFEGAVLSKPAFQTANGQQVEASTYLGTQTFTVFAQLAD